MTPSDARAARRLLLESSIRAIFSKRGIRGLTKLNVSRGADCSQNMVNNHFGTAAAMREWAVNDAVKRKDIAALAGYVEDGYTLPEGTSKKLAKDVRMMCKK